MFLLALACLMATAPAQAQLAASVKSLASTKSAPSAAAPADPLGRNTPRGALLGFMQAAQKGDTTRAIEYLQIPRQHASESEKMAQDLRLLLDRAWTGRVTQVSDSADPSYSSLLPANYERAGSFVAQGKSLDLLLVRVDDSDGHVWLISWTTLAQISDLANEVQAHEIEGHLPSVLVVYTLFDLPLWVWCAFLAAVPIALLAGWTAVRVIRAPAWILHKLKHKAADSVTWETIRPPIVMFATAFAHVFVMSQVRTPLLFRIYYGRVLQAVLIIAAAWLMWDLVSAWTRRTRTQLCEPVDRGTLSLVLLGHRVLKAAIVLIAALGALANAGLNLTTALAGLGLGGIAVALAAQKTIENLFGGVSILTDRVIRVGDYCKIGDCSGTIEDIGLRSTRIRTLERTQVSIPNGSLSTMLVENYALREKHLIKVNVGVRYETTPDQLQVLLADVRAMLYAHRRVETETARIRLMGFGESSLNLELYAYALTGDYNEFLAIREDVLLRVIKIVNDCGSGLAFPSRTLYMTRDQPNDAARTAQAEQRMQQWQKEKQVPFPDYSPQTIAEVRDTLTYPQDDSALKPKSND